MMKSSVSRPGWSAFLCILESPPGKLLLDLPVIPESQTKLLLCTNFLSVLAALLGKMGVVLGRRPVREALC